VVGAPRRNEAKENGPDPDNKDKQLRMKEIHGKFPAPKTLQKAAKMHLFSGQYT
jgi:hypothetical protein